MHSIDALKGQASGKAATLRHMLPTGQQVPNHVWQSRHRAVLMLVWVQLPFLFVFTLLTGHSASHALLEITLVAAPALVASSPRLNRRWRSVIATFALLMVSSVLVHASGGRTEMHFHFFVMLGVVALYQDWAPFLFSIAFVALEHGLMSAIDPNSVFDTPYAQANPWLWSAIHGAFVLAASAANLAAWKISERYTLHDALTDLPNRAVFKDRLEEALAGTFRHESPMAVLYVDLDYFKAVNDTLGHDAGDQVLIEVGERIRGCVRGTDTVARLGGDEFGVVLPGITDQNEAVAVAKRIIDVISEAFVLGTDVAYIGASIGIAIGTGKTVAADAIVKFADDAMYAAKVKRGTYEVREMLLPAAIAPEDAA